MKWATRINYMKDAKVWIWVSVALSIAGIIAYLVMGFNKGIDFTGGELYDIQYTGTVTSAQVEKVATAITDKASVQIATATGSVTGVSEFYLRTPELTPENEKKLMDALNGVGTMKLISQDEVSGTVSGELTQRAILAVVIAALLQIVYLWIRFELKFGVTAVIALLHDVLITCGLVAIFRIPINSPFVAAILTILGYSINDTVIVFDRIRENLARRKKGESLVDLTTRSIQEVITRSLYTVFTVQFAIIALLIWGGPTIRDFIWSLFIGITSGMYSSIFIAAALWVFWEQYDRDKHKNMAKSKPAKA
ncbi:MAG: protein translocase subunit SecF [Mycobacterium leprae]